MARATWLRNTSIGDPSQRRLQSGGLNQPLPCWSRRQQPGRPAPQPMRQTSPLDCKIASARARFAAPMDRPRSGRRSTSTKAVRKCCGIPWRHEWCVLPSQHSPDVPDVRRNDREMRRHRFQYAQRHLLRVGAESQRGRSRHTPTAAPAGARRTVHRLQRPAPQPTPQAWAVPLRHRRSPGGPAWPDARRQRRAAAARCSFPDAAPPPCRSPAARPSAGPEPRKPREVDAIRDITDTSARQAPGVQCDAFQYSRRQHDRAASQHQASHPYPARQLPGDLVRPQPILDMDVSGQRRQIGHRPLDGPPIGGDKDLRR